MNELQKSAAEKFFSNLNILILVTSDTDRDKIYLSFKSLNLFYPIDIYSINDMNLDLDNIL